MAVWSGLEEFRDALKRLPTDLRDDAAAIMNEEVEAARAAIDADYAQHEFTGNLRARLLLTTKYDGPFGYRAELRNRAHHAWLFDNGSEARHYVHEKSGRIHATGKMWGKTPPAHTFVRNAMRARERIQTRIVAMMEAAGLEVTVS
jgi:hypothetical protein